MTVSPMKAPAGRAISRGGLVVGWLIGCVRTVHGIAFGARGSREELWRALRRAIVGEREEALVHPVYVGQKKSVWDWRSSLTPALIKGGKEVLDKGGITIEFRQTDGAALRRWGDSRLRQGGCPLPLSRRQSASRSPTIPSRAPVPPLPRTSGSASTSRRSSLPWKRRLALWLRRTR